MNAHNQISTIENEILQLYKWILLDKKCILILCNQIINTYFITETIPIEITKEDLLSIFNIGNFRGGIELHAIQRCCTIEIDWKWDFYIRIFAADEFADIYWDDLPTTEARMLFEKFILRGCFTLVIPNNMPIEKTLHYMCFKYNQFINQNLNSIVINSVEAKINKIIAESMTETLLKYYKENKRVKELCNFLLENI